MKNLFLIASLALGFATLAAPTRVDAQEPFVGQIILVGENFCPRAFASAEGQLLAVSQNDALFSLLGTMYGGDGRTTFGLPDLRGRAVITAGQGPGLSPYTQGSKGGRQFGTLTSANMPSHSHAGQLHGTTAAPGSASPAGALVGGVPNFATLGSLDVTMNAASVSTGATGGNQQLGLSQPFLGLRYCVALFGIYPSRS
ncbi:MAG: tail fiber protein [Rhodobacter sp.]|jgi:microcystin-dependent protein|nr:tail fiber protein [Rhodobacter sp.]